MSAYSIHIPVFQRLIKTLQTGTFAWQNKTASRYNKCNRLVYFMKLAQFYTHK